MRPRWCSAIVLRRWLFAAGRAPLAAGNVPVWVAASFDGDLVLIPVDQVEEAVELLRRAGHRVVD
jgi:hypothetical protein